MEFNWTGEDVVGVTEDCMACTTSAALAENFLLLHTSLASNGGALSRPTISEIATTNSGRGFT